MGRILATRIDAATRAALDAATATDGLVLDVREPPDALKALASDGADFDLVVVGTEAEEPVRMAQRIFSVAPRLPVLIVTEPDRSAALRAALSVAPYVSEHARCLPQGSPAQLVDSVRELSAQKRTSSAFEHTVQALNARLARFEQPVRAPAVLGGILDNAPVGVVLTDLQGRIVAWNKRATAVLERTERAALGSELSSFFNGQDQGKWREFLSALTGTATTGASRTFDRQGANGTQHLEIRGAQLVHEDGQHTLLFLIQDVSERVALLDELRQAIALRDDFLSIASHELRTPLTALGLQLHSVIVRDGKAPLPDGIGKRLELMSRQVNRMSALIENLLDVSRIVGRRLELDFEEVELTVLARDVVSRFAPDAARSKTPLELVTTEAIRGKWDRLRVEQVLSNLIGNALKFGAGKPVQVRVERGGEGAARLVVRDHGIGIPAEDQGRVFDRFERAVSAKNYGGFGLGLWISRQFVVALGGTIELESERGRGATFVVTLPLQPSSVVERPAQQVPPDGLEPK